MNEPRCNPCVFDILNRLVVIERFLEIRDRDNPMEANSLDNRITDGMNANMEVMKHELHLAIKSIEQRLAAIEAIKRYHMMIHL